jgi:hypothetical protein
MSSDSENRQLPSEHGDLRYPVEGSATPCSLPPIWHALAKQFAKFPRIKPDRRK